MAFRKNKSNSNKGPSVSLSDVLAQTVANHYPGASIDGTVVTLAATGIQVDCEADDPQELGNLMSVSLYMRVSGGPFGPEPSFASISGYAMCGAGCDPVGQSVVAVTEAGCFWTCTFLETLESAGLIPVREAREERHDVTLRGARIGGRGYQVWSGKIDRTLSFDNPSDPQAILAATRSRFGADATMTSAVLATDTLPVLASNHAVLLSTFAMVIGDGEPTTEVKVHGGDWPPSWGPLVAVSPGAPGAITLLRELAVAVPVEASRWDRNRLAWTLGTIGQTRTEAHQAAGWRGWHRHGGVLQAPLTDGQIAAANVNPAALPADHHHFITQVGWGAGPGYGLQPPTLFDLGVVLATAGDQVTWYLSAAGGVWADTRTFGTDPVKTHDSFDLWYADWLDNALAGLRPWNQWDGTCSSLGALSQMLEDRDRRGIEGSFEGVKVTLAGDDGQPTDPCHHCQATFARFGMGDEVWVG
ncbi:MAG: hypothetical protein FWF02_13395 [Micrococcales bacterium]|nr:hypothetical protein [Micrococcales bacterium]MCL2668671.1 hypothetical protein [Micrococcales bacterium]